MLWLLDNEPVFVIRAKDNKSIKAIEQLGRIYAIPDEVTALFREWRETFAEYCKDPD
jgi:hypothetical protein